MMMSLTTTITSIRMDLTAAALHHGIDSESIQASDEFEYIATVRASHKIKGFVFAPFVERGGGIRIVCALATNALEVHSIVKKIGTTKGSDNPSITYTATKLSTLDMYGHPTGVRSISLSSDDILGLYCLKERRKGMERGESVLPTIALPLLRALLARHRTMASVRHFYRVIRTSSLALEKGTC